MRRQAVESRAPIVVTRQSGKGNVVILPEQEFADWQETVHLLANPVNAERRGARSTAPT